MMQAGRSSQRLGLGYVIAAYIRFFQRLQDDDDALRLVVVHTDATYGTSSNSLAFWSPQ
jgi:hypothetical protein